MVFSFGLSAKGVLGAALIFWNAIWNTAKMRTKLFGMEKKLNFLCKMSSLNGWGLKMNLLITPPTRTNNMMIRIEMKQHNL